MKKLLLLLLLLLIPFSVRAISGTGSDEVWDLTDGVLTIEPASSLYVATSTAYGEYGSWRPYASEVKKIIIKGFKNINYQSFQNLPELEEVVLPESMPAAIDKYAFYNCPKLKKVNIPKHLIVIGEYAFYNTAITEVEISEFTDWIEDNAFPEGTTIIRPAEYDELIAAGTAGPLVSISGANRGEGYAQYNTCYNEYYNSYVYDDTAFWKLYKDGTLVVWGTTLKYGYNNSRAPWGCYKKQIKKVIFNADKTGTLTKEDQLNPDKKLANTVYAVYSNKPVEEIMNNRIKEVRGEQFWDCREDCQQSLFYIDSIIYNRGVEYIGIVMNNNSGMTLDRDVYINKYVKTMESYDTFATVSSHPHSTIVHLEVSPEDYINNGYSYALIPSKIGQYDYTNPISIIVDGKFINDTNIDFSNYMQYNSDHYRGGIVNDIDDYYVSINDNLAPKEIEVDGQTLYLYETYRTNAEGEAKLSLPDMQEGLEFYLKEITPPEGYELDPVAYKIDMSKKNIDRIVQDLSIEDAILIAQKINSPDEGESNSQIAENPLTKDNIVVLLVLFAISALLITYGTKKERELS